MCSNSFVKIMFNEYSTYCISNVCFRLSFLLRQGENFLLEIHSHSRDTFSQYSKEDKTCQNGSGFVILLNPIQARLFFCLKVQEWVFRDSLMISGTIQARPMKLCDTAIVLIKAYHNTKRNFQKSDL